MKTRILAVLTAVLLVFTVTSPQALLPGRAKALSASEWTVPEGFNEHDYNAVASFLEQTDSDGVKNGLKLNPDYDPNDPNTWLNSEQGPNKCGVYFTEMDGEQRLWMIALRQFGFYGVLDLSDCPAMEMGSFENGSLLSADFSDCQSLTYISVSNNRELESLGLSGCPAMNRLFCDRTAVTELPLGGMPALEGLFCYETPITELDLSNCTQLSDLSCTECSLGSIDVSNCNQLQTLQCQKCDLEELILPSASIRTNLVVNCTLNSLSAIDLSNGECISALYCSDNRLTSLDLTHCTNLKSLDCSVNVLTEIDVSSCSQLIQLICTDNRIKQFDFSANPQLAPDYVYAEGEGTVGCRYNNMYGSITAFVIAVPDEGSDFTGWYSETGELLSSEMSFGFSSLIGVEPGLIARFAEKTVVPGDANGDGAVDTEDALLVLRAALGIGGDPEALLEGCDMDENGVIDTTDALLILRLALGIS